MIKRKEAVYERERQKPAEPLRGPHEDSSRGQDVAWSEEPEMCAWCGFEGKVVRGICGRCWREVECASDVDV